MAPAFTRTQKTFFKKLGLRLRELRNQRDMTLEDTEEQGIRSWKHLQRIESGEANITMATLIQLAKIYRVHPSDILKGL